MSSLDPSFLRKERREAIEVEPDAAIGEADGLQRRGCLTGAGVMPSQRASPVCL